VSSVLVGFSLLFDSFVFFLGALFGSFFALCIHRIPREISVVRPASRCEDCETPISWYDNIPIISYLVLRGRCRNCGATIGLRNWLVELGSAVAALVLWRYFGVPFEELIWLPGPEAARALWPFLASFAFFGALLVASLIDLETFYLPNAITIPGIPLSIVLSQALPSQTLTQAILGASVGALGLAALRTGYHKLTGREGIGLGDVYLIGMIGGFVGISLLPIVLFLASLQGSVIGIAVALSAKKSQTSERQTTIGEPVSPQADSLRFTPIPFGPFLSLGAVEALLFGRTILDWYWGRL